MLSKREKQNNRISLFLSISSSTSGGEPEQRAGARERRGSLSVRSAPQLHGGGDGERRAVRRHRHRLLRPGPRHLPQPRRHAPPPDRTVQLQVAQR